MAQTPSDNLFISDLPPEVDQAKLDEIFKAYGNVTSSRLLPGQGKHAALVRFETIEEATWIVDNLNGNIPQGLMTPICVKYANSGATGVNRVFNWQPLQPSATGTPKGAAASKGGTDARFSPYGKGVGQDADPAAGEGGSGGKGAPAGGKGASSTSIKVLKKGLQISGALPGGKWSNDDGALWIGGLPTDTTDIDLYEIFSPFGAIPSNGVRAMLDENGACKGYGFVNYVEPAAAQAATKTLNGTILPDGKVLQVKRKGPPVNATKGKG